MLANTKENQENQPKQSNLYALKNLKFYGCKNMNVLVGAPLYCNEELSWPEKNNKSFDDITKKFKKRRKIRKAKSATRLRIMNPDSQLISVSTSKVYKSYGTKLLDNLLAKEKERQEVKPLFKHNITAKMRSKMIDWMVEWFAIYKKSQDTFLLAVYILDTYLQKTEKIYGDNDVHLLGLWCIFIASKYADVIPICLTELWEKIGHNTFGPKLIKKTEIQIMDCLGWNIDIITPSLFISYVMLMLKKGITSVEFQELFIHLELATLQYAKMVFVNEDLLSYKPSEIAIGAFSNACQLLLDKPTFWQKQKMDKVYGFFQDLLQQNIFDREKWLEAADALKAHIGSFGTNYKLWANYKNFSLIIE